MTNFAQKEQFDLGKFLSVRATATATSRRQWARKSSLNVLSSLEDNPREEADQKDQ